jgi:hypothetical protein
MKRAASIAIAAVAASAVVTAMACFPDVTFLSGTGGGVAGAPPASSSGATTTGSGGHTSTSSTSSSSTSTSSSSAADSGTPCEGTDPCDCDGDGDRAATAACDHDGGDCNDHDPLVNSKQTMWFTVPGSNGWDYNCDTVNEYEYVPVLACDGFTCSAGGWTSTKPVPDCGMTSEYGVCNGYPCSESLQGSRAQGCH